MNSLRNKNKKYLYQIELKKKSVTKQGKAKRLIYTLKWKVFVFDKPNEIQKKKKFYYFTTSN